MRYKLLDECAIENDIIIYNPLSVNWDSFEWVLGYYPHKITKREIEKPYLISYAYYNTVIYEDIIFLLNGIENSFDLTPGTELKIPKEVDIKTFINNIRKK